MNSPIGCGKCSPAARRYATVTPISTNRRGSGSTLTKRSPPSTLAATIYRNGRSPVCRTEGRVDHNRRAIPKASKEPRDSLFYYALPGLSMKKDFVAIKGIFRLIISFHAGGDYH